MKKKIVTVLLACMLSISLFACGSSENEFSSKSKSESSQDAQKEVTYESILKDYTEKLQEAAPTLVEEYKNESKDKAGDINALAELSNSKISKLAEISNEGISKMAEIHLKSNDENEVYEEWAKKLTDVYTDEAKAITDAYTESASGISAEDMLKSLESMIEE